jgi:serine phosphatase RsbU (regulator of sigma subunit)
VPLLELHGDSGRRRFKLAAGRVVIGRHPGCDVVLDAPAVSRQHAAVTVVGGRHHVEDLQSRNGTTVNGRPLLIRQPLEHGDEIDVCGHRIVFLKSSRAAARTVPAAAAATDSDSADFVDLDAAAGQASMILSEIDVLRPVADQPLGPQAEAKLRALIGLHRAIGSSLSLDEVLPRLLDGLLAAFPRAERGFVLLIDPPSGRLVLRARLIKGEGEPGPLRLSLSLIRQVAETRRAVLSADAAADSRFTSHDSVIDCRIRSVMCVPVVAGSGELLGVVQIDSRDVRNVFSSDDLDVLAGVAGQAAQAIEQALAHDARIAREQIDRDLALAQRVQQGLLPSCPPCIEGYEVFDFYESARQVGGDFFAYVPLPDGRLAVVLADVSGKGVAAALLMAALSADIRYCLASEPDLGSAVSRINETFLRGGWDDRFATLVVVVLDPPAHRATICNAGHLPPLLRAPDGGVQAVAGGLGGLPLGMVAGHEYRCCEIALEPGAVLALYTDGISEALDHEQRCFGLERLERVVSASGPGAAATGRGILADVERHAAGQVRSDDICLVCLGRTGGPAAHPPQRPAPARRGGRIQPRR